MIKIIHSYINSYIYFMINIWIRFMLHWYLQLFEGVDTRAIIIQREQYGGTVHLFIGTGHSPSKNTFMTLTCAHNRNINHQGLTSLFLFDSAPCLTFVATLSQSCRPSAVALTFVVNALRQYLHLEDLRQGRGSSTSLLSMISSSWGPSAEKKTPNR
jgi:hypothetical protein